MSSDEWAPHVARARLLPRAQTRPGPLQDLKDALHRLYLTDQVTLDQLVSRIHQLAEASETNPACEPMATPGRDAIRAVISGPTLPQNVQIVTAVAAGLVFYRHPDLSSVSVLENDAVRTIRMLWSHAAAQRPIGRLITDVRPVEDLGVHSVGAVDADGTAVLPPYIERTHDEALHQLVESALAGRSGIAVLVSGSTAGKTRAAAEALHRRSNAGTRSLADSGWRIWPPIEPTPYTAVQLLDELPLIGPRTVVWLNEAQRFLLDPPEQITEQIAAALRALLNEPSAGPVLILGTLWPDYWHRIARLPEPGNPDPHAVTRALLQQRLIPVDENFADSACAAARATGNEMLTDAVNCAADGEVAQYLAGIPDLMSRYELGSALERAVIHAAMDARRLGCGEWHLTAFLRDAATAYLTARDRRRLHRYPDWFGDTVNKLTCMGKADTSVLEPGPDCTCRLEDYLDQYGRRSRVSVVPLDPFWDAVEAHIDDADVLHTVARSANDRYRYRIATRLHACASDAGHLASRTDLIQLLEQAGHQVEAEDLARQAVHAGDSLALVTLAEHRAYGRIQDRTGTKRLCFEAAREGEPRVLDRVADLFEQIGDHDGEMRISRQIMDTVHPDDERVDWAEAMERTGNTAEADRLALRSAEAGDEFALQYRVLQRLVYGDLDGAHRLSTMAVAEGHKYVLSRYKFSGDRHERDHPREVVSDNRNDIDALVAKEREARAAADRGDPDRLYDLAMAGDEDRWLSLARFGLNADGSDAEPW